MRQQRDWWILIGLCCIALAIVLAHFGHGNAQGRGNPDSSDGPFSEMPYLGHTIKLTRAYNDYEEYKDDPNNIDPSQIKLVQQLVSEAPVARFYASSDAWVAASLDWTFPGYGWSSFGGSRQSDGSLISMQSHEIPRADRDRFLVFLVRGQTYKLLDDFIAGEDKRISKVRLDGADLSYYTGDGILVFKHAISVDSE